MIGGLESYELLIDKILNYQKNLIESYLRIITEYQERLIEILANNWKYSLEEENKAVFRARIQKGGRIAIPEIEREALKLKEGDVVKVVIVKE